MKPETPFNWYLIYRNKEAVSANTVVPIECQCCGSIPLTVGVAQNGLDPEKIPQNTSILVLSSDNAADFTYTTAGGESYTIGKTQVQANFMKFKSAREALSGIKDLKVLGRENYFLDIFRFFISL